MVSNEQLLIIKITASWMALDYLALYDVYET